MHRKPTRILLPIFTFWILVSISCAEIPPAGGEAWRIERLERGDPVEIAPTLLPNFEP